MIAPRVTVIVPACNEEGTRLLLLFVTPLLRTSYDVWISGLSAVLAAVPWRRAVVIFSCKGLAQTLLRVYRRLLPSLSLSVSAPSCIASTVALGVPILYLLPHFRGRP